jgi:hypothetical protein
MSKKNDGDQFSKDEQERALEVMCAYAQEMGIERGVAAIVLTEYDGLCHQINFAILNRLDRNPNREKYGEDDTGTNYLGVALAKIASMMSTGLYSGWDNRPPKLGEVSYRGGLTLGTTEGNLFVAFSGGTEDQDVQLARAGLRELGFNL